MDGWLLDKPRLGRPPRLRVLRELAEIKPPALAEEVGCHVNHYRKLEYGLAQPSPELLNSILRTLSKRLGRTLRYADVAHTVPSKRKQAA